MLLGLWGYDTRIRVTKLTVVPSEEERAVDMTFTLRGPEAMSAQKLQEIEKVLKGTVTSSPVEGKVDDLNGEQGALKIISATDLSWEPRPGPIHFDFDQENGEMFETFRVYATVTFNRPVTLEEAAREVKVKKTRLGQRDYYEYFSPSVEIGRVEIVDMWEEWPISEQKLFSRTAEGHEEWTDLAITLAATASDMSVVRGCAVRVRLVVQPLGSGRLRFSPAFHTTAHEDSPAYATPEIIRWDGEERS